MMDGIYTREICNMHPNYWYRNDEKTIGGLCALWRVAGRPKTIVEIGSADGGSACVLAMMDRDASIVCVDPWENGSGYGDDIFRAFLRNTDRFDNISYLRMTDDVAVALCPDASLDLVYYDAVHTEDATRAAIVRWLPKLKPCAWMAGHDYSDEFPGVMAAVDALAQTHVHRFSDTSWAFQKLAKG